MFILYRTRLPAAAAAVVAIAVSSTASAQRVSPGPIPVEGRVRFTAPTVVSSRQAITGSVVAVNDTALVVRWDRAPQDEPLVVPFRGITSLDVSEGRVSGSAGRARGAKQGAAAGAFLGALSGLLASVRTGDDAVDKPKPHAAAGLVIGALVGSGAGALLGGHGHERWRHLPIPQPRPAAVEHRETASPSQ